MTPETPPPSRDELAGALAANAARKPRNLIAPLVPAAVALVVGAPFVVALLLAMVVYAAAAAHTMFDAAEVDRVTAAVEARAAARRAERQA
jgi:hypothetical protein